MGPEAPHDDGDDWGLAKTAQDQYRYAPVQDETNPSAKTKERDAEKGAARKRYPPASRALLGARVQDGYIKGGGKKDPFVRRDLASLLKPPVAEDRKMMRNLKAVAAKAWALNKDGVLTDLEMTVRGAGRTNRPTTAPRTADGDEWCTMYVWRKNAPVGRRVTKRMWHRQISGIKAEGGKAPLGKANRARKQGTAA